MSGIGHAGKRKTIKKDIFSAIFAVVFGVILKKDMQIGKLSYLRTRGKGV